MHIANLVLRTVSAEQEPKDVPFRKPHFQLEEQRCQRLKSMSRRTAKDF